MKKTAPHDTLLFIVDMQDGMWADEDADYSGYDDLFRAALERRKILFEEKCHEAMYDMVPPIHDFVESMRDKATPVWVTMVGKGFGDVMAGLGAQRGDMRLEKNGHQSPIPENRSLIEQWKDQGYKHAIVVGAFAGDCVRNTAKDLHEMGFAATVIADLIIDGDKPGSDEHLASALAAIEKSGAKIKWLADMQHHAAPAAGKAAHLTLDL